MTARNGMLIGLLATVVASFGFYTLAIKPKRAEATKLATQIDEQQQALDAARALLATNEQARDGYRKAYATVVRLGKAVPADDDTRSLVVQLEAAAKEAKVDFSSINLATSAAAAAAPAAPAGAVQLPPGATVGPAGFPALQFSFEFRGEFFGLGDFFKRLHGFVKASNDRLRVKGRLLTLESLKLTPAASGFPRISAAVTATAYLVSPLEGLTAGATAAGPAAAPGATTPPAGTTPAAPADGTAVPAPATATSTGGIR